MKNRHTLENLIALVTVILIVTPTIHVVNAEVKPPYKEGDWFKYRIEVEVDGEKCWAYVTYTIEDVGEEYIDVKIEASELRGACESFPPSEFIRSGSKRFYLDKGPESFQEFIDPRVSGSYDCSVPFFGLVECKAKYSKGVLTELKASGQIFGPKFTLRETLVDSSVFAFKPIIAWLIIIGIVGALLAAIVIITYYIVRRSKKAQLPPPSPPPPPPPPPQQPPPMPPTQ